jgi:hypothetical protein
MKANNIQRVLFCSISENTFIKLKKIFSKILINHTENTKLGGPNKVLQVDETACNRRRLITNPTSEEVYVRGTKWVIVLICEETKRIKLSVLEDRRVESMKNFFEESVLDQSLIKSDGYPTYPAAIASIGCTHQVVNHSVGFVSQDGTHTNLIENIWAHLKTDIRSRRGVMFTNLKEFIKTWECFYNFGLGKNNVQKTNSIFLTIINDLYFILK